MLPLHSRFVQHWNGIKSHKNSSKPLQKPLGPANDANLHLWLVWPHLWTPKQRNITLRFSLMARISKAYSLLMAWVLMQEYLLYGISYTLILANVTSPQRHENYSSWIRHPCSSYIFVPLILSITQLCIMKREYELEKERVRETREELCERENLEE